MEREHAYGKLLVRTDFGRWYWDDVFYRVDWIPKGRRRPTFTVYLSYRENTEVGALCVIVRLLSGRKGGGS